MTPVEFKRWILAQLKEIEPHIGEPPTPVFSETVATAKAYAYLLGLHDFALSLPDNELGKTPLTAANQLRRCLKALETPVVEQGERDTLTPPEVAKLLKVSPDKVLGWIRDKKLRASNLSNGSRARWAVNKADLELFLRTRQPEPRVTPKKKPMLRPGAVRRYS